MSIYPSVCAGYSVPGEPGEPGEDGSLLNSWQGTWLSGVVYTPGDLVEHEGSVYLLGEYPSVPGMYGVTDPPEPPDEPWEMFARRGSDGDTGGSSLNYRGSWMADETYPEGSVVSHDGGAYVASIDAPEGTEPPEAPWEILAAKGDAGPAGPSPDVHWLAFSAAVEEVASTDNVFMPTTDPLPQSDTDWYDIGDDVFTVLEPGLYVISAHVSLSFSEAPDPTLPTLRSFQISVGAQSAGSAVGWTVGRSWAATVVTPVLRLTTGTPVRVLLRQDSGLTGSMSVNLSVTQVGS